MAMDVVEYEIKGAAMQFVEIEPGPREAAVGETGSLCFMDTGIDVDTEFGDGHYPAAGILDRLPGAGQRLKTGGSLFISGFFGGKSLIRQKLQGNGLACVHAGGTVGQRELAAGLSLVVDSGCFAACTPGVTFEIPCVDKFKIALGGLAVGGGLLGGNLGSDDE